jgi:hypothetical protein
MPGVPKSVHAESRVARLFEIKVVRRDPVTSQFVIAIRFSATRMHGDNVP